MKSKADEWLTPDNLILLEGWCRDGLTDAQIAHNIGIRRETLIQWKKRYPIIANTLKKTKDVVDKEVEGKLYQRAMGYDYEEVTEELRFDRELGDYKMVVTKRIKKHMPPDTAAMIFWLKNRKSDTWKDAKTIEPKSDGMLTQLIEGLKEKE